MSLRAITALMRRGWVAATLLAACAHSSAPMTQPSLQPAAVSQEPSGKPAEEKPAFSQPRLPDGGIEGIISPCGLFLGATKGEANLLALLPGQRTLWLPPQKPKWWVVDDVLLESVVVSQAEMELPPGGFRDLELLRRHREWEINHTRRKNGWPAFDVQELISQANEGTKSAYSIWAYQVPGTLKIFGQTISRVAYLTVAIDQVVLVLSAPLRPKDDPDRVVKLLRNAAEGLERKRSADELAEEVGLIRRVSLETKSCRQFLEVISVNLRKAAEKQSR